MKRVLWLLLIVVLASPLAAEDDPAIARGFNSGQVFNVNDIDSINTFNGNLLVTIPIGPEFRTNGALRYQFKVHYESNIWEHREVTAINQGDPGGTHYGQPRSYRWWDHNFNPPGGNNDQGSETYPTLSNAGFGWWFGVTGMLGVYRDESKNLRPAYRTLDGNWHSFVPRLHGDLDGVPFAEWNGPVLFTRDGTYLRVRRQPDDSYIVDRPDGIQEEFVCIADCATNYPFYVFRQMSDAFGNVLWLQRGNSDGVAVWTFFEGTGNGPYPNHTGVTPIRAHRIVYRNIPDDCTNEAAVDTVTLAMTPQLSGGSTYRFVYDTTALIYRSREMFWGENSYLFCPFLAENPDGRIRTTLLTAIESPEPLTSAGTSFEYIIEPDPADYPNDLVTKTWGNQTWKASHVSGRLARITLPSGGAVGYKYERRPFRRVVCHRGTGFTAVGIRERQVYKRSGGGLVADGEPWRYFRGNVTPGGEFRWCTLESNGTTIAAGEILSLTMDPLGNVTAAMFEGLATPEFGQPYLPRVSDGAGRFLSTETYQCSSPLLLNHIKGLKSLPPSDGTEPIDPRVRRIVERYRESGQPAECGSRIRSTWVRYEDSGRWCGADGPGDCTFSNRRVASMKTVFHDDGNSTSTTDHANFDGFGHYRETRTGGTLHQTSFPNGGGGDERRSFTNYNPGVVLAANGSMTFPNGWTVATYPWTRLETYDLTVVREQLDGKPFGGALATQGPAVSTLYRFDDRTGFLLGKRTLRKMCGACDVDGAGRARCNAVPLDGTTCQGSPGSLLDRTDLLVAYERAQSAAGHVTMTERHYGGDLGTLDPDVTLTAAVSQTPDYVLRKELDYGSVSRSAYLSCSLEDLLTTEMNVVHPLTGLVTASTDSSGVKAAYRYDKAFRLVGSKPSDGDPETTYTYAKSTGNKGAEVTIATGSLRTSSVEWDSMGRVAVETSHVPDDSGNLRRSVRTTSFHPNGWKNEESTTGPPSRAGFTHYKSYDAFGRPTEIVHPDSGYNDGPRKTKYAYKGIRETEEEIEGVAVRGTGGRSRKTFRTYDRFGRLVRVSEPSAISGTGDAYAATRYTYDPAGRLQRVDAPNGQVRLFEYDGRGFLLSETHPELAGRSIRHAAYDARGHAGQLLYSRGGEPASRFDLVLRYDGAERLERVESAVLPAPNETPILQQYVYHPQPKGLIPANDTRHAGKLQTATRYNWVIDADAMKERTAIPVTRSYTYLPARTTGEGQLARGRTQVESMTFDVTYAYDGLGNVTSTNYPQMQRADLATPLGSARNVTFQYREGLLTAVPNFAWRIGYHQNGLLSSVGHGTQAASPSTDVFGLHPQSMALPASIETTFRNVALPWSTGPYRYDAAGNILSIGGTRERYEYDTLGRLTKASLPLGSQAFRYDANANLVEFAGTAVGVDAATNRLTDAEYDEAGNVVTLTDPRSFASVSTYEWDALRMMNRNEGTAHGKIYVYDAFNERVGVIDYRSAPAKLKETWSIRGAGNQVLRDFTCTRTAGTPAKREDCTWRDYVYRGGSLLAGVRVNPQTKLEETIHYHLDHLGSVRRVSDNAGNLLDQQDYFPYGEETVKRADDDRMKFTGHERDDNGLTVPFGDLDYMHARHYAPTIGRFLSLDPVLGSPAIPQSWNRYAYVRNNPLRLTDPTGREDEEKERQRQAAQTEAQAREAKREEMKQTAAASKNAVVPGLQGDEPIATHGTTMDQKTGLTVPIVGPEAVEQDIVEQGSYFMAGWLSQLPELDLEHIDLSLQTIGNLPNRILLGGEEAGKRNDMIDKNSRMYAVGEVAGIATTVLILRMGGYELKKMVNDQFQKDDKP